jgi:DNA-binding MarR family transcriptional regulator
MEAGVSNLARSPGFLLSRVGTAIQAVFKEVLAHRQMRPLHFLLLAALDSTDGVSQQELCRVLTIDSGNMVELIDRLEELEFAKRSPDPRDRRRHLVRITPVGRQALASIGSEAAEMEREFFAPLTDGERTRLAKTLAKLYANTSEGRHEAPPVGLDAPGATR